MTPKEKEGSTRQQKVSKGELHESVLEGNLINQHPEALSQGEFPPALEAADTPQFITYPTDVLDVAAGEDAADR